MSKAEVKVIKMAIVKTKWQDARAYTLCVLTHGTDRDLFNNMPMGETVQEALAGIESLNRRRETLGLPLFEGAIEV